jgi:carbonic anhydrase
LPPLPAPPNGIAMSGFNALLDGYRRFRNHGWGAQHQRWAELAEGQSPRAMVIACSDSRVDPSLIFDARPGEIFVVRNVANLVPPFETGGGRHGVSAALEFGVTQLNIAEIVVMGHERCGGISAALTGQFHDAPEGEGGFVATWMRQIDEPAEAIARDHGTGEDAQRMLEEVAIRQSLANLRSFPFVSEREKNGTLKVMGCHFSIRDGELWLLDEAEDRFRPV